MKKNLIFIISILLLGFTFKILNHAGILPYSKYKGKVYFLLGREAHGHHQHTWADFGGKADQRESNKETAIREFTEESRGAFGGASIRVSKNQILKASKDYIEKKMSAGITNPGPKKYYTMFLAKVDYIDPAAFFNGPYIDHEKDSFRWVNAKHFIDAIKTQNRHNALYESRSGVMKVRPPFAEYFIDTTTRQQIEKILGLPSQQPPGHPEEFDEDEWIINDRLSFDEGSESEEEWVVTPINQSYIAERLLKLTKKLKRLTALLK